MANSKTVDLWALSDLCTPWCVHVVATLQIAETIAGGIERIDEIAQAVGCDAGVLQAVLGHLAGKGLFEEPEPGRFALNQPARQLLDPAVRLSLDLEGIGGRLAYAWGTLLQFTRTGVPAYATVFGKPFWEDLAAHPSISAAFDRLIGPEGHGTPNADFQIKGGWESIHTVADVGGGTGAMLAELLRIHPHLQGVLIDQPTTVARAGEIFQAAGVGERVRLAGQSFFDPLPTGADLYLLRGIINDWPDHESSAILTRCAEAARVTRGRVVILKSVGPDDEPKDITIEMVLLGGKHRSLSEFKEIACQAGLVVTGAGQQSAYFVVECQPA